MPYALPERIWPLRLARSCERLDGALAGDVLPRLRDAVSDIDGAVGVSLCFQKEGGIRTVRGKLQVALVLCCQRCLQPMNWRADVDVATRFELAHNGSAKNESDLESIRLDDDESTSLRELVEDEILLAMPQIARHDEQDCSSLPQPEAPLDEAPRKNPFAVLAGLKASD